MRPLKVSKLELLEVAEELRLVAVAERLLRVEEADLVFRKGVRPILPLLLF